MSEEALQATQGKHRQLTFHGQGQLHSRVGTSQMEQLNDRPRVLGSVDTQDTQTMPASNWAMPEHSRKRETAQIGLEKDQKNRIFLQKCYKYRAEPVCGVV